LIAICETDGFIPRFYIDSPNDKVDRTIQDIQNYTRSLITEETNIESMIEKAMKDIAAQKEKEAEQEADAAGDEESFEAELFDEDGKSILNDEDFAELSKLEEEAEEADDEYLKTLIEDGEIS